MTKEEKEKMEAFFKYAAKEVASWPAWKRGILEASSKATNDVPRKPVLNEECIY